MLQRVLGISRDDLGVDTFQRLIDSHEPESQHLEFKELLVDSEIAHDVTAMANGGGGVVIYGIKDIGDSAGGHAPVKLEGLADKVTQKIRDLVEPRLRIDVIEVPTADGLGYLVVDVPMSTRAPHCWRVRQGQFEYPMRVGNTTTYMRPTEVAERFRSEFRRVESIASILDKAVRRNLDYRITGLPYARAHLGAIPIEDQGRLFTVVEDVTLANWSRPPDVLRFTVVPSQWRRGFQTLGPGPVPSPDCVGGRMWAPSLRSGRGDGGPSGLPSENGHG